MRLRPRHHLAENPLPLVVGKPGRIGPVAGMRGLGDVRPRVVAVRREVQPARIGRAEAREMRAQHRRGYSLIASTLMRSRTSSASSGTYLVMPKSLRLM